MIELLPLFGFVFFGLFSPGPNVVLITASGARFGLPATLPHILGIALGVSIIAGSVGFGLGSILELWPVLRIALQIIAAAWIIWMAWRLWHAKPAAEADSDRPFTFTQAVLFQWVNPKIWAVAMSATAYITEHPPIAQSVILALTFPTLNLFILTFWAWAGTWLSFLRSSPKGWRIFMRIMALGLGFFSLAVFL